MSTASQDDRHNILIIGSAIAGPVFALQLLSHPILRAKYRPILFDSATSLPGLVGSKDDPISQQAGQSGAAVALTKQAMRPLRTLNLGPELDDVALSVEKLSILRQPFWGPQDGSREGVNVLEVSGTKEVGVSGGLWTVERGRLQCLLIKNVLARGGEVLPGKRLANIKQHAVCEDVVKVGDQVEARFADGTSYHGALLVGADGAWSTTRRHLYTPGPDTDSAWKPDFQNLQILHGISNAQTTDTRPSICSIGLRGAALGTWTIGHNRQYWFIYSSPALTPPSHSDATAREKVNDENLSKQLGHRVHCGGYDAESTREFIDKFRDAWHPSAGSFGHLIDESELIIRVGLWQKVFTRIGNVRWGLSEQKPKECKDDLGHEDSTGNIVLIGDAARALLPSAGQGAAFAIEDATVLANSLLNHPPTVTKGIPDFTDAIKVQTKERLPRYGRIAKLASLSARMAVGRSYLARAARDYLPAIVPTSSLQGAKGGDEAVGKAVEKKWWEKIGSGDWLTEAVFEVKEEGKKDPARE